MGGRQSACGQHSPASLPSTSSGSAYLCSRGKGRKRRGRGTCTCGKVDDQNRMGLSRLHEASEKGDLAAVTELLRAGADPNRVTSSSHGYSTPLVLAASNGHEQCVLALLRRGACPNGTDDWGNTAVFKAATYNHAECVIALVQHSANPGLGNKWGATPLQYSALQGHHRVVELLLAAGCDPDSRGEESVPPPLSAAALHGHVGLVKTLLAAGAEINGVIPGLAKHSPLYCTISSQSYYDPISHIIIHDLCHSLRQTPAEEDTFMDCVRTLIKGGATVDSHCLNVIYSELLSYRSYLVPMRGLLSTLLLRATVYDDSMREEMENIMCDLTNRELGSYKTTGLHLIRLIYSIGYTPSTKVRESLGKGVTDGEALLRTFRRPRSLENLAALCVRKSLPGNPLSSRADSLRLPRVLRSAIVMD